MMRRLFLGFLASLVAVSSIMAFYPTLSAHAASIYDDVIEIPSKLIVQRNQSASEQDISTRWGAIAKTCSPQSDAALTQAISSGSYFVNQVTTGSQYFVQVGFDTRSPTLTPPSSFSTLGNYRYLYASTATGYININQHPQNDDEFVTSCAVFTQPEPNFLIIADVRISDGFHSYLPFISTYNVSYPSGYDGEIIPDTFNPPQTITPVLRYVVEGKYVSVMYVSGIPTDMVPCTGYQVSIFDRTDDENNPPLVPDSVKSERSLSAPYGYKLDKFGDYNLHYTPQRPVPCAPFPSEFNVLTVVLPLKVDGGSYSGSTDDLDCTTSGSQIICEEPSPYEDCSVYDTEVTILGSNPFMIASVESIFCVGRNILTAMRVMLLSLVMPSPRFIEDISTESQDWFMGQFGMAGQAFFYLYEFAEAQYSPTPTCNLSVPTFTFFGSPVSFDFCVFQQKSPNVYNAIINFGRAAIGAAMLFALAYRLSHLVDQFRA